MDQPLSVFTPTLGWRLRVAAARVHQQLGSAGVVGLLVLVLAVAKGYAAWADQTAHRRALQTTAAEPLSAVLPAPPAASTPRVRWPAAADVPTLLTRMERTADIICGLDGVHKIMFQEIDKFAGQGRMSA